MQTEDIARLFAYDRWATRRVLDALEGVEPDLWARERAVGDRGLGSVLVHHLGASQRWRVSLQSEGDEDGPSPERDPLPSIAGLRDAWEAEWAAVDAWLPTMTDGFLAYEHEGVPIWLMLVHVVNHGSQHRAEAAALLTSAGRSPGDLDLIDWAELEAAAPAAS